MGNARGRVAQDPVGLRRAPNAWMYHSVSRSSAPDPHGLRVHPDRLDQQLRLLRRAGIRGASMREVLSGEAGRRSVALTFDDGYADFVTEAMPVLARHRMTATVFVVAGKLGGTNAWDRDAPQVPLVDAEHVRTIAVAGHEIGSHSASHAHLAGAPAEVLQREVTESRSLLEGVTGSPVLGFCFPYGEEDEAALEAVRSSGYSYACAVEGRSGLDRHRLPRYYIGQRDGMARLLAKHVRHRARNRSWGHR
jgi:peptidoglycan/xylan/chitin deacetylase (PgdA/CDA1 family)